MQITKRKKLEKLKVEGGARSGLANSDSSTRLRRLDSNFGFHLVAE